MAQNAPRQTFQRRDLPRRDFPHVPRRCSQLNLGWPSGVGRAACFATTAPRSMFNLARRHKTMPYLCREKECGKRFSLKTGTVMQSSKPGLSGLDCRHVPALDESQER